MASTTKTTPQDLPPKGGYAPYPIERSKLRTLISGRNAILGYITMTTASAIVYFYRYKQIMREKVEARSARMAMFPLLLAERDREFLKQLNRNKREEEELMKDVPNWEVGTWLGEPIYKTIPNDEFVMPSFREFYSHSSYKEYCKRAQFELWT